MCKMIQALVQACTLCVQVPFALAQQQTVVAFGMLPTDSHRTRHRYALIQRGGTYRLTNFSTNLRSYFSVSHYFPIFSHRTIISIIRDHYYTHLCMFNTKLYPKFILKYTACLIKRDLIYLDQFI